MSRLQLSYITQVFQFEEIGDDIDNPSVSTLGPDGGWRRLHGESWENEYDCEELDAAFAVWYAAYKAPTRLDYAIALYLALSHDIHQNDYKISVLWGIQGDEATLLNTFVKDMSSSTYIELTGDFSVSRVQRAGLDWVSQNPGGCYTITDYPTTEHFRMSLHQQGIEPNQGEIAILYRQILGNGLPTTYNPIPME
jgi:hypothetical protein